MPLLALLMDFAVALGIGTLIGLQREQSGTGILAAGSRTFPLVALLGALCFTYFEPILPVAFGAVVLLAALGYHVRVRDSGDPGLATPIAATLTFLYGAMAMHSDEARLLAVIFGVLTTVVLALKRPLHGLARRISADEARATLLFLVVAFVVLPLLPNRSIDALLGLNPRFVWMMVTLVSAIDLVAYLFVKAFATRRGHFLAGVVGGLVSSTATTVSMSRRTRAQPVMHWLVRIGIVVASAVMLVRMLFEVAAVHPNLLRLVAPPLMLMLAWMVTVVVVWLRRPLDESAEGPLARNPFRLAPALIFGGFFAAVLILTEWLGSSFGDAGIYGAALASGLVDVDAVTLTLARLAAEGNIADSVAATGILLVVASNFLFKIGIILLMGTRRLAGGAAIALGAAPVVAVAVGLAWNL